MSEYTVLDGGNRTVLVTSDLAVAEAKSQAYHGQILAPCGVIAPHQPHIGCVGTFIHEEDPSCELFLCYYHTA